MNADELRREVRKFIDKQTMDAMIPETEACRISAEVCEDLSTEYEMRLDELMDEEG